MGLLQQYQLYHRHQPLPSHHPRSPAAAVLHSSHGTCLLSVGLKVDCASSLTYTPSPAPLLRDQELQKYLFVGPMNCTHEGNQFS